MTLKGSDSNHVNYFQVIDITILDVNDNNPTFANSKFTMKVSEELGPQIFDLPTWSDNDSGDNGRLKQVQITNLPDQSWPFIPEFKTSGDFQQIVLKITKSLDREQLSRYDFVVTIEDKGYPPLTGSLSVTIEVQDINDNSPIFNMTDKTFYMDENVSVPYHIVKILAFDNDADENGRIQYSMSHNYNAAYFTINQFTGDLYLELEVDYESCPIIRDGIKGFSFSVSAHDMGQSQRYSVMSFEVIVRDENDNYPAIKFYSPYMTNSDQVELKENVPPKTYTATVIVTDKDSGKNGEYDVLIDDGGSGNFELENNNGYLVLTAGKLDREESSSYSLVIHAIDKGVPPLKTSKLLDVIILDENDNIPQFTETLYSTSLMENVPVDTLVLSVEANDPDFGLNGSVQYKIESQSKGYFFQISSSGSISSIRLFDAEDVKYHVLNISASDGGTPSLQSFTIVNVTITDFNDNYPIFRKPLYTCQVPESISVGSNICSVEANDLDDGANGEIEYSIEPSNDMFAVDELGNVKLCVMLDFETKISHQMVVMAKDKGRPSALFSTSELIVLVNDVNDEAPIYNPSTYTMSIPEGMIFTKILQLHIADKDQHDTIVFSFLGNSQHFAVSNLGIISNTQKLQYSGDIINLKVEAQDGAGNTAVIPAYVQIEILENSNDLPVFPQPIIEVSVIESFVIGHIVTSITALTKSLCSISYSIESMSQYFTLNGSTGELMLTRSLDFELIKRITIPVTAICHSTKGYAIIEVTVIDINDNSPQCDDITDSYVKEDALIGSTVHSLLCHDEDSGMLGELAYRIETSTYFSIGVNNGDIKLVSPLDRETESLIEVSIQVCDKDEKEQKCNSHHVTFHVMDVNDNVPQFLDPLVFYVSEDVKINHDVGKLKASDADNGKNGQIVFTVLNSITEFSVFSSGQIVVNEILDYEKIDRFFLNVRVSDQGNPKLSNDTIVTIIIQDANDNAPKFEEDHYYFDVKESEAISYFVGSVFASDKDTGSYGEIIYSLADDSDNFVVEAVSGKILLAQRIDYEGLNTLYNIKVEASDHGNKPLKTQVTVTINIIDVNDNIPIFSQEFYTASFNEDVEVGYNVIRLSASDKDGTLNNQIQYSIIGEQDKFRVDSISGNIYSIDSFDFETQPSFNVSLKASDNGSPILSSVTSLLISLLDVNDNEPVFGSNILYIGVIESTQPGTIIKKVHATDIDSEDNSKITYAITSESDSGYFFLDNDSGDLKLLRKLSYSDKVFELQITATDHGNPQLSSSQNIRMTVIDVNDNAPLFTDDVKEVYIVENLRVDSFVFHVSATDKDSGAAGIVNYNISSTVLKIGVSDGNVYIAKAIDRESVSFFETKICAIDQASPLSEQLSTCKEVSINILDINDNTPIFLDNEMDMYVSENTRIHEAFTRINASDADLDLNSTIRFSILNQFPEGRVSIASDLGDLMLLKPVDYEVSTVACSVTIAASDLGTPSLHSIKQFNIFVQDYNDNAPSFSNPTDQRSVYLSGSVMSGSTIFVVSATDMDSGKNGQVTYSIGKNSDGFMIDSKSGKISTLFDIDSPFSSNLLTVTAHDSGTPSLYSTMLVNLQYHLENSQPVCPQKVYLSVLEDTLPFSNLFQVECYDLDWGDRGSLHYEILDGNIADKFYIRPSGEVTLNSDMLDHEVNELYNLVILVEDNGKPSLKNIFLLEIKVVNVNDEKPVFDEDEIIITMTEDVTVGSLIKTFVASDADADILLYSISEISQFCTGYFEINSKTGQLTLSKVIDDSFMTVILDSKACILSVSASDGLFVSYIVASIIIQDIDNSLPIFYSSSSFTARLDNSAIVGAVGATDNDTGDLDLDYTLISSSKRSADYIVDQKSGIISCPDFTCSSTNIIVKASGRLLSKDKSLSIEVSQSASKQVFSSNSFSFIVLESANVGFILGKLSFINDPENISIESGNKRQSFEINNFNLVVKNALDHELISSYNLTLCANLQGISSFAFVSIVIEDVNDNAPLFLPSISVVEVNDGIDIGTEVYKAIAIDKDSKLSGKLLYYIKDSVVNDFFRIDTFSGQVFLKRAIKEAPSIIYVYIKAKDQGLPALTSNTLCLKVKVIHQPSTPRFQQSLFNFSTYVNAVKFSIVGQIHVQSDTHNDYRFAFETESEYFTIYPISGKIIQKASIVEADISELEMKVRAFSYADPSVYGISDVLINKIQSLCNPSPCQNDGFCIDHIEIYECECIKGTIGKQCECVDSMCNNEGFCSYNSSMDATQCLCEDGSYRDNCGEKQSFVIIAVIAGGCVAFLILLIVIVLFCIKQQRRKNRRKSANHEFDKVVNGAGFGSNKRSKGQLNLKESICLNPINVSSLEKQSQPSYDDHGYTNHDYDLDSPHAIQQLSSHNSPQIFDYAASDSGQSSQCTEAVIFNKLQQVDEPNQLSFQRRDKDSGLAGSLNTLCHFDTDLTNETYTQDYLHDWGPKVQNLVNVLDLNEGQSDEDSPIKEEFV